MRFVRPLTMIAAVFRRPVARETQTVFDQQRALIAALKGENYQLRRHLERAEVDAAQLREAFAPLISAESVESLQVAGGLADECKLVSLRVTKAQLRKACSALRDRD